MTKTQLCFILEARAADTSTYGTREAVGDVSEGSDSRRLRLVNSSSACQGTVSEAVSTRMLQNKLNMCLFFSPTANTDVHKACVTKLQRFSADVMP